MKAIIEKLIKNELEVYGVESVEIGKNIIKVNMATGRAFANLFPTKEERFVVKAKAYGFEIQGYDNDFIFSVKFDYARDYEEFMKYYPSTVMVSEEDNE